MTIIVADTTCGLPLQILEHRGIPVIPQIVMFGEESYHDGKDFDTAVFLQKLKDSPTLPKTAAPEPSLYFPVFEEARQKGESVIVVAPTGKASGTLRSAETAALDFPDVDIRVIDTQTISCNLGSLVLLADKMAKAGKSADEIVMKLTDLVPCGRLYFVVDTLEYLAKGGRIGGAKKLLAELLESLGASAVEVARAWRNAELVRTRGLGHHRILRDRRVIARAIAFDSRDQISPRTDAKSVSFVSRTLPHIDGLFLRVAVPALGPATLHFDSAALKKDIDLNAVALNGVGGERLGLLGWRDAIAAAGDQLAQAEQLGLALAGGELAVDPVEAARQMLRLVARLAAQQPARLHAATVRQLLATQACPALVIAAHQAVDAAHRLGAFALRRVDRDVQRHRLVLEVLALVLHDHLPVVEVPGDPLLLVLVDRPLDLGELGVVGIDKQLVGEVAANIRKLRKPEPYKGKGVRYAGEHIRRKVGKAGK